MWMGRHGYKTKSIETVRSGLVKIRDTLRKGRRYTSLLDVSEEDVFYLKDHMGVAEYSARLYLASLSSMLDRMTGSSVVKKARIMWNRPTHHRAYIDKAALWRLYGATDDPALKLVLVLGAFMGLRRAEICGIRLGDIRRHHIDIYGKGHGDGLKEEQPMPERAREEIRRYLLHRQTIPGLKKNDDRLLVFTSKTGTAMSHGGDLNEISDRVRSLGRSVGIEVTAHSLRRLFCTTIYYDVSGRDLATTQKLMRHARPETTVNNYLQPRPDEQLALVEKLTTTYINERSLYYHAVREKRSRHDRSGFL